MHLYLNILPFASFPLLCTWMHLHFRQEVAASQESFRWSLGFVLNRGVSTNTTTKNHVTPWPTIAHDLFSGSCKKMFGQKKSDLHFQHLFTKRALWNNLVLTMLSGAWVWTAQFIPGSIMSQIPNLHCSKTAYISQFVFLSALLFPKHLKPVVETLTSHCMSIAFCWQLSSSLLYFTLKMYFQSITAIPPHCVRVPKVQRHY